MEKLKVINSTIGRRPFTAQTDASKPIRKWVYPIRPGPNSSNAFGRLVGPLYSLLAHEDDVGISPHFFTHRLGDGFTKLNGAHLHEKLIKNREEDGG